MEHVDCEGSFFSPQDDQEDLIFTAASEIPKDWMSFGQKQFWTGLMRHYFANDWRLRSIEAGKHLDGETSDLLFTYVLRHQACEQGHVSLWDDDGGPSWSVPWSEMIAVGESSGATYFQCQSAAARCRSIGSAIFDIRRHAWV